VSHFFWDTLYISRLVEYHKQTAPPEWQANIRAKEVALASVSLIIAIGELRNFALNTILE
jgi:hypothetical protein